MNFLWNESVYRRYHAYRYPPIRPHHPETKKSRRFSAKERRDAAIARLPDSIVSEYQTMSIKELCRKYNCGDVVLRDALVRKGGRIRTKADQLHRAGVENFRWSNLSRAA